MAVAYPSDLITVTGKYSTSSISRQKLSFPCGSDKWATGSPSTFDSQSFLKVFRSSVSYPLSSRNSARPITSMILKPPYSVVITGSTKGVGYSLAREFLKAGDNVTICSRSANNVEAVVEELAKEFGENRIIGINCDVSKLDDVTELADTAVAKFGKIDIWINNAGSNAYSFRPLIDTNEEDLVQIVSTNTLGVMICCKKAIEVMTSQPNGGHIFNMDGAGADGNPTPRFAAYGATKRGLAQFTKSLQAELKMLKFEKVTVHNLSPGMVTTELLMSGSDTKQAKFFINALADTPQEVSSFLVPRIRDVVNSSSRNSSYIKYLTPQKAYSQIFARLLFQERKNRHVLED